MTFLNPLLLWGALGAVIPLVIHLWGRQRPRRTPFPTIRFIQEGRQRRSSLSRLREVLLLLLRMLLIIVISAALAGPVVEGPLPAVLSEREQQAVIVLDVSAGMGYLQDGATTLDRGRAAVRALQAALPETYQQVVYTAAGDIERLEGGEEGLDGLLPAHDRASLLDLLERADIPGLWDPRSRLFLITNLQETSLRGGLTHPLPQPPVVVDVGPLAPANHALADAFPRPACHLQGRPLDVGVTVQVWGEEAPEGVLDIAATLDGDDIPGRSVPGTAGVHRTSLRLIPRAAGDLALRLSLPPDNLPVDNVFHRVERVRERLRVVILHGRSDPLPASLALNPGGDVDTRIEVTSLAWEVAPPRPPDADALILADCPEDAPVLGRLPQFMRDGGGVLLFTGPDTQVSPALLGQLLGTDASLGDVVQAPGQEPLALVEVDTHRPPLEAFAGQRAGNLLEIQFTRRRAVEAGPEARVPARFSDGTPAMLQTLDPDRRFMLVNTTLDDRWSNAPHLPVFVPLVHRLVCDVVGPPPRVWHDGLVGRPLAAEVPPGVEGMPRVTAPDGSGVPVTRQDGRWVLTPPLPGVYEADWDAGGAVSRAPFAANLNPAVSDPTRIAPAELKRRLGDPAAVVVRGEDLAAWLEEAAVARANLTPLLILLALALLAVETTLSARRRRIPDGERTTP